MKKAIIGLSSVRLPDAANWVKWSRKGRDGDVEFVSCVCDWQVNCCVIKVHCKWEAWGPRGYLAPKRGQQFLKLRSKITDRVFLRESPNTTRANNARATSQKLPEPLAWAALGLSLDYSMNLPNLVWPDENSSTCFKLWAPLVPL